jgi:hypothetical protein
VPWMGEFVLDDRSDRDGKGLAAQVAAEIGEEWPMLSAFDGDVERAKEAAKKTDAFIEEYGRRW